MKQKFVKLNNKFKYLQKINRHNATYSFEFGFRRGFKHETLHTLQYFHLIEHIIANYVINDESHAAKFQDYGILYNASTTNYFINFYIFSNDKKLFQYAIHKLIHYIKMICNQDFSFINDDIIYKEKLAIYNELASYYSNYNSFQKEKLVDKYVYGENHFYGFTPQDELNSLKKCNTQQLIDFCKQFLNIETLYIIISSPELYDIQHILNKCIGNLEFQNIPYSNNPCEIAYNPENLLDIKIFHDKDSPVSYLSFILYLPEICYSEIVDVVALLLQNELFSTLREKYNYIYGVFVRHDVDVYSKSFLQINVKSYLYKNIQKCHPLILQVINQYKKWLFNEKITGVKKYFKHFVLQDENKHDTGEENYRSGSVDIQQCSVVVKNTKKNIMDIFRSFKKANKFVVIIKGNLY